MSSLEYIGIGQLTVLFGIFFRMGGMGEAIKWLKDRVTALEQWRENARNPRDPRLPVNN